MSRLPEPFRPMMATLGEKAFDSSDHVFEVKWDGVRTLAFCDDEGTRLYSRTGRDVSAQYPEFLGLHERLDAADAVLDGEIVAMDEAGRPSFGRIQHRIGLSKPGDIRRGQELYPLELLLFDVPFASGEWLKESPLEDRMQRLDALVGFGDNVSRSDGVREKGRALFEAAQTKGLEGIVAKKLSSYYYPDKRTRDWTKIKVVHSLSAVVCGWTAGEGSRAKTFGALLMGMFDDAGALRFIGAVGTGFKEADLRAIRDALDEMGTQEPPIDEVPKEIRGANWVHPVLVAEVAYREMTDYLRLRAPSFKGFRSDVEPADCLLAEVAG